MLRVGLTGGVGSGKSTLARILRERGAAVCDADRLVEELYLPRASGADAVSALFGASVLDRSGAVDRRALADLVLDDPAARQRLEAAIHPLVHERIAAWLAAIEASQPAAAVALVEAALLVESGSYRDYHRVVVVCAPVETRQRRALASGWTEERFARLAAAQTDDRTREAVADYVIHNQGGVAELAIAGAALWPLLQADGAALAAGRPLPARRGAWRQGAH